MTIIELDLPRCSYKNKITSCFNITIVRLLLFFVDIVEFAKNLLWCVLLFDYVVLGIYSNTAGGVGDGGSGVFIIL